MASDHAPGKTAQQLAAEHIAFAISNLRALAEKGGRGASDRVRASLALLELAGAMTPQPIPQQGGQGGKLVLVDREAIERYHARAAGERGDGR